LVATLFYTLCGKPETIDLFRVKFLSNSESFWLRMSTSIAYSSLGSMPNTFWNIYPDSLRRIDTWLPLTPHLRDLIRCICKLLSCDIIMLLCSDPISLTLQTLLIIVDPLIWLSLCPSWLTMQTLCTIQLSFSFIFE
jgi:hypothetical protein